jgi:hypothetical protein
MAARVVSDLRTPIGLVDQDRCTRTDVELRRQYHIGRKPPLEEFFARTALAQHMVQLHLYGPTKTLLGVYLNSAFFMARTQERQ